ncbi:hypothetical protein CRPA11_00170 [Pseudomonas aeruginosa]
MELIEYDETDTLQRRVILEPARKDPFSDYLDPRTRADPTLQANTVTNGLTHLLAQLTGHALSSGTCSHPARLEH